MENADGYEVDWRIYYDVTVERLTTFKRTLEVEVNNVVIEGKHHKIEEFESDEQDKVVRACLRDYYNQ